MRRLAASVVLAGLLALPAAAHAHSSTLRSRGSVLIYDQFRKRPEREKNTLTVLDGTGPLAGFWKFVDPRTKSIVNSPPCVPLDAKDVEVACPSDFFTKLIVMTKVGNDTVRIRARATVDVHGGVGNDQLYGGPGRNRLYGDAGNDRLVAGANGGAILDGGTGKDVLDARNGKRDTIVACAVDVVKRDRIDVVKAGC